MEMKNNTIVSMPFLFGVLTSKIILVSQKISLQKGLWNSDLYSYILLDKNSFRKKQAFVFKWKIKIL